MRRVTDHLTAKNIEFETKDANAPHLPQARGIERFWALCKSRHSGLQNKPKASLDFGNNGPGLANLFRESREKPFWRAPGKD